MPALSNKSEELRFKENDFACFGTQRYKYQYGMLLHDIPKARENTMGSFILPPEDDFQSTVDAQEFGETVELTRESCVVASLFVLKHITLRPSWRQHANLHWDGRIPTI